MSLQSFDVDLSGDSAEEATGAVQRRGLGGITSRLARSMRDLASFDVDLTEDSGEEATGAVQRRGLGGMTSRLLISMRDLTGSSPSQRDLGLADVENVRSHSTDDNEDAGVGSRKKRFGRKRSSLFGSTDMLTDMPGIGEEIPAGNSLDGNGRPSPVRVENTSGSRRQDLPPSREDKVGEASNNSLENGDGDAFHPTENSDDTGPTAAAVIDKDLLYRAVSEAGLNAFGAIFVECWVLSTNGTRLQRPPGGHWMNPAFVQSLRWPSRAVDLDQEAPSYPIGASLPGAMFRETSSKGLQFGKGGDTSRKVHWRQIRSILSDPHIPNGSGRRMERLNEIGIGLAAAVPFNLQGRSGIVVYMSRTTANYEKLRSPANERYLIGSTDLIGAAFAIRAPREECDRIRRESFRNAVAKVRRQLIEDKRKTGFAEMIRKCVEESKTNSNSNNMRVSLAQASFESNLDRIATNSQWTDVEQSQHRKRSFIDCGKNCSTRLKKIGSAIFGKLECSCKKWTGSDYLAPSLVSNTEALYAFVGALLVMAALIRLNDLFAENVPDWSFDAGWYASTLSLVFTLTAGPPSQPRQIVASHTWCALVGMAYQAIPSHVNGFGNAASGWGVPLYLKQALSTSTALAGLARLGIIHPPATALAFAFATNERWGWRTLVSLLLGDVVIIMMSVVLINLNKQAQYPIFWSGLDVHARKTDGVFGAARERIKPGFLNRCKKRKVDEPQHAHTQRTGNDDTV